MSADNTIVVLTSPKDDGFEYRVLHCQAFENIYWNNEKQEYDYDEPYAPTLIDYFGKCNVIKDYVEAMKIADALYVEMGYVEYGIEFKYLPRPFDWYRDHAERIRNFV